MKILAIESAALEGGVALLRDGEIIAESVLDISVTYSEKLLPAIDRICRAEQVSLKEIGLIAVDIGPGSFTGLRIGLATAQGLGQALGIPLVGVISLEAIAAGAEDTLSGLIAPCLDARRGEIYAALYRQSASGLVVVSPPEAVDPALWGDRLMRRGEEVHVIGPGIFPRPAVVGRMGWRRFISQGHGDDPLLPLYLRRPV